MFNENKIFRSVEHRREYIRKQVRISKAKKRKANELVKQMRNDERRPVYKRSKFKPHRYDVDKFNKMHKILGLEKAMDVYYYQNNRHSKQFWWEQHFDHNRYVTAFGRIVLDAKKRLEEKKIRDQFETFMLSVDADDIKNLKNWVDRFGGIGTYNACFKEYEESDSDSDSEIDVNDFLGTVDYHRIIPIDIQSRILNISNTWERTRIPATCFTWEDTCPHSEEEQEEEEEYTSGSDEEFDAGF